MTLPPQYFGVAATTAPNQVRLLERFVNILDLPSQIKVMNGPLVSYKSLNGMAPSNPAQYPRITMIPRLMSRSPRILNVIHYNSVFAGLCDQLSAVASISDLIHGIQLNILWPDVSELVEFRRAYPGVLLILQISRKSIESVDGDTKELAERLREYSGVVDYALFDPSSGTGIDLDQAEAVRVLRSFTEADLPMRLGVTGGLRADKVYWLGRLLQEYPGLCWDAQSNLRSHLYGLDDQLDLAKCFAFLSASSSVLRWSQPEAGSS